MREEGGDWKEQRSMGGRTVGFLRSSREETSQAGYKYREEWRYPQGHSEAEGGEDEDEDEGKG